MFGGSEDLLAAGQGVVDGCERDGITALDHGIGIFEHGAGPFDGGDQFGRANAAILVGVDQGGGLDIKFNAGDGAGKSDPQLLIELIQAHEVGAGFEFDLIKAASAEEAPVMCGSPEVYHRGD